MPTSYKILGWIGLSQALVLLLNGCGGGGVEGTAGTTPKSETLAVIANISTNFDSSEISIASAVSPYDVEEGYAGSDKSDIAVAVWGDYFYRLGKFGQDNITKYSFDRPGGVPEWQVSTNDPGKSLSNPYDILFVSETKAYVLRYGASSIWVVNPSDPEDFKIKEIDLSHYDDDGVPEMSAGVIVNGRLYVAMQRMDSTFAPDEAYVAVINTATDKEVNTFTDDAHYGIKLSIKNPHKLVAMDGFVYVVGSGRYATSSTPPDYTGGIEKINTSNYTHTQIIDDDLGTDHPYGLITDMAIVSSTVGYFKGSTGYKDDTLYRFDPSTGATYKSFIPGTSNTNLRALAVSPSGEIWIGIGGDNPGLVIASVVTEQRKKTIPVNKDPAQIVFIKVEKN
ncbi:conserved hypothetical protein [Hahella chejuensis KCTC 2396]|uniref:Uncharacterized protein n=1 Tax=Hahella chejuensis (strain KCTC 2396) TaxID=349521 RepID=Q2SNC5_HAHCH|nr:hypothetical protein [Hahella chejuensis]ABC27849.1 conserved hypothetical protein [Hahella chejuensis KCTC 2396]